MLVPLRHYNFVFTGRPDSYRGEMLRILLQLVIPGPNESSLVGLLLWVLIGVG